MQTYLNPLKCEYCSKHVDKFVPPEIPRNPKLIVVGEAPWTTELKEKHPFVGEAGGILRPLLPVPTIILNASNVFSEEKPTTEIINMERESHLLPILKAYPDIPVVSLGQYAAQALMGGKRSDSSMAGEALWLHDRNVLFTYHPAYYLRSGKDGRILKHIEAHIRSAVAPPLKIKIVLDELPNDTGAFEMDIESTSADLPFYGSKLVLLGIMPERKGVAHQFTAKWLSKSSNRKALQAWIDRNGQVVGHNLMYDILHSEAVGLNFDKLDWFDTEIALKDKGHDLYYGFGLKGTARHLFFAPPWEAKFHRAMKDKAPVDQIPLDVLSPYNAGDLYYTKRLAEARSAIRDPFVRLDNEYVRYVKRMVQNGIFVSKNKLARLLGHYEREREKAMAKGRRIAHLGKDFNYNSPKQVLPVIQRLAGKDIENTREQTLTTVFDKHPFISVLLDVRSAEKTAELLNTSKKRIVQSTGVIHTKATVHGAETSRTSTKEPNIQNWPEDIRTMLVSRYDR